MAGKAVAVDLGSHTSKVVVVRDSKNGLSVLRFGALPAGEDLAGLGIPLAESVVGLAGRDMTLRYTQVPPTPDWQLRNLMELEIQDLSSQSGGELSADYNLLPIEDEEGGMDTVLMALARNDALQRASDTLAGAGGSVSGHVPNCVAIYNAFLRCGPVEPDVVTALVNLGHETIDIALVRGTDLLFARNLTGGAKVFDDAIAGTFNVSPRKAETLRRDLLDLDPASRGRYASGQTEKVTMAAIGASSMIVSAVQSSIAFCNSQTRIQNLQLDRVLLSGGAARTRGVVEFLRDALRCPVELFDPFKNVDLSQLPAADAEQLEQMRYEAVAVLGLAATRLDNSLYALEILPERVKRKRRFVQRTVYDIAAAVVVVVVLVLLAMNAKQQLDEATKARRQLSARKSQIDSAHDAATELVAANATSRALVTELAQHAIPLDGVLKTMRALQDTLPDEAWLKQVLVKPTTARGKANAPIVEVHGAIKPVGGNDVSAVFRKFSQDFRGHPEIANAAFTPASPSDSQEEKAFVFTIDFGAADAATRERKS